MDINPDPNLGIQPHVIRFLTDTDWVEFIDEYHKGVRFKGLLAARIPDFPVFNPRYVAPDPQPGRGDPGKPPQGQTGA
jgi:hypothetical protein